MNKASSRDVLLERTTEAEVFQDMDNFDLLNDPSAFAYSLRFQFPKFSKGIVTSDFDPFVKSNIGEHNLVSLGRLSFPNEWQIKVACKDIRESLIRLGRTKINTRTCWISPLSQSEVRGFIHWIPTAIPNARLEEILRAFGEILLMENQKQSKWKLKVMSDSRYFGLYLKSGKTMDDLPHFIRIDDFYGLVTIRGRSPSCFHCKQPGHRKSECKVYREKISDYCNRPPGVGKPRNKPRGKRFRKNCLTKKVDQEVQTETTCSECIKERLAAEAAKAEASATLACDAEGTGEACDGAAAGAEGSDLNDMMLSLSVEDTVKPGFWRRVREEKKRLKQAKEDDLLAEFRARVKAICQGPVQEFSNLSASLSATGDNQGNVQESASSEKSGQEQEAILEETEVKDVTQGPIGQLDLLQKNIEDVLAYTKETLQREVENAKKSLQVNEAEKSSAGKKKKRKKQKKKKAAVEPQVNEELKED